MSSETSDPVPQQQQQQHHHHQAEATPLPLTMEPGFAQVQGEIPPEDNSLLTFEEDVEFDPLKRSNSVQRSDSLSQKAADTLMPSSSAGYTSQPALLDQQQLQPLPTTMVSMTTADPSPSSAANPTTSAPSNNSSNSSSSPGQFGDLAGISLDLSFKKPPQKRQESLGELYQMAQAAAGANTTTPTPKSMNMAYPTPGMVPMVSTAPPGVQVPLGVQGGVVYGTGVVPVMYAPQGAQGVMYHQVRKL